MLAINHILSKRDGLAHHFARILRCGTDKRRAAALEFFNRFRATVDAGNFDRARFARLFNGQHRAPMSSFVRDAKSGGCSVGTPPDNLGFRLVRRPAWYEPWLARLGI